MKKWGVLILMSLSMLIIVIDTTVMNVSISALVADLNTTVGGIQTAIALYALVMASFMLMGGKLADVVGKKRVFIVGLIVFGVGTTAASFSRSLGMLIIGWSLLEGIGSALMLPNIQTILRGEYKGADRATAYGAVGAVGAIGASLGPIVGGFLTTYASWRWAFRLEVLIVIVVLLLQNQISRDVAPAKRPSFDFNGAVLSIVGWSSIVLGILLVQDYGVWSAKQPLILGSWQIAPFGMSVVPFVIGFGLLAVLALFRWERNQERQGRIGLFRPSLFSKQGIGSGFAVRFLHMAIMAAYLFLVPLLLQLTFDFTAIQTGVALLPYSLGIFVFALIGARLSSRFAAKRLIQTGFVLGTSGLMVVTLTITPRVTFTDLALGVLFGVGMGLVASQIVNLILSSGADEETAEIAGLNGTFEQLGNSIGVALVGTIMLVTLTDRIQQHIEAHLAIPIEHKSEVITGIEKSIELVSDTQMQRALDNAGVDDSVQKRVVDVYATSRTQAFQAGMAFLVFLSLAALVLTTGLVHRKLVEA